MSKVQMGFFEYSSLSDDMKIETDSKKIFTVGELRKFLSEENIKPSDIFASEKLHDDPQLKKHIEQQVEFELHYQNQKLNEEMDKEIEEDEKRTLIPEG